MKDFKDYLVPDLDIFLSMKEFAEYHNINGDNIKCLIDDDISEERNKTQQSILEGGVFSILKSIFIKKEDIEKPAIQERFYLDNEMYLVEDVKEAGFLYEIIIRKNDY